MYSFSFRAKAACCKVWSKIEDDLTFLHDDTPRGPDDGFQWLCWELFLTLGTGVVPFRDRSLIGVIGPDYIAMAGWKARYPAQPCCVFPHAVGHNVQNSTQKGNKNEGAKNEKV